MDVPNRARYDSNESYLARKFFTPAPSLRFSGTIHLKWQYRPLTITFHAGA